MNKRKILVTALALSIIAILSVGTLAWFSDSDEVTNEFFVADSDDDTADEIFSVDVWEEIANGSVTDKGIYYKDILPGDELVKKVRVENTGHYAQYVRVVVTLSDAREWGAVFGLKEGEVLPLNKLVDGLNADLWSTSEAIYDAEQDTFTYVLYYKNTLNEGQIIYVFDTVKIPSSLTQEQAATFNHGFEMKVKAQAVQTENVGANAYEAFQTVGMGL